MRRFPLHVVFFMITLSSVTAILMWVQAVPTTIGQWMIHEAESFLLFLFTGPPIMVLLTRTPRTWPLWFRKLLLCTVGWAMMCGGMVALELRLPSDGLLLGVMAVVFAIALPWMLFSETVLAASDPS